MEWSRAKNIIILLLLVVNAALLVLVVTQQGRTARYESAARTETIQVLEKGGIDVEENSLPSTAPAVTLLTVSRSDEAEQKAAEALLGSAPSRTSRGGLTLYASALGSVSFRSGGEFTISPETGFPQPEDGESEEAHTLRILSLMGASCVVSSRLESGSVVTVTARQTLEDAPVFGASIAFRYQNGVLTDASGRLFLGSVTDGAGEGDFTVATALLRFYSAITDDSGDVCRAITGMTLGFQPANSLTDPTRLTALWYITTDTAEYCLDPSSGALTKLAA